MDYRYHQLLQLGGLLYELQDQAGVRHTFGTMLSKRLPKKYAELGDLLLRQLTLLRRTSRHFERGAFHSEEEDLAATLQLLVGELKTVGLLTLEGQLAWSKVAEELEPGRWFRRKDVERWTGYAKTQAWRWLGKWEQQGLISRVGGSRNHGYYYALSEEE